MTTLLVCLKYVASITRDCDAAIENWVHSLTPNARGDNGLRQNGKRVATPKLDWGEGFLSPIMHQLKFAFANTSALNKATQKEFFRKNKEKANRISIR